MVNPQHQSRLVSLPGELRNEIYRLSLCSSASITNPYFGDSIRPHHIEIPRLGSALLRTCKTIHNEINSLILLESNTFVFTRVSHIHAFFARLSRQQARLIRSITIDLREASIGNTTDSGIKSADIIGNEWLHYLMCNHYAHVPGIWCSKLSTMKTDVPEIKTLVLDLTDWLPPFAGTRQDGWRYLQKLLGKVRGLDSIVLKGNCLKAHGWNPKPVPWGVGPWFSPAFSTDEFALLELLGGTVRDVENGGEKRVFTWRVCHESTILEVKIIRSDLGTTASEIQIGQNIPDAGLATWDQFLELKAGKQANERTKFRAEDIPPSTQAHAFHAHALSAASFFFGARTDF